MAEVKPAGVEFVGGPMDGAKRIVDLNRDVAMYADTHLALEDAPRIVRHVYRLALRGDRWLMEYYGISGGV